MTPDDIRRLYAREVAATAAEAEATEAQVQTDPELARAFWETTLALAPVEPAVHTVLSNAMGDLLIALINERAQADDAFALRVADVVLATRRHLIRPRVPRGKAKMA